MNDSGTGPNGLLGKVAAVGGVTVATLGVIVNAVRLEAQVGSHERAITELRQRVEELERYRLEHESAKHREHEEIRQRLTRLEAK